MDIYPFCVVILIGNTNFYHIDQDFENVKIILDYYYNSFSFDSTNYADWFILKVLKRVFILDQADSITVDMVYSFSVLILVFEMI